MMPIGVAASSVTTRRWTRRSSINLAASSRRAVAEMVPEAPIVRPDPARVAMYDRMYRRVYMPGLKILRRLSGDIASAIRP